MLFKLNFPLIIDLKRDRKMNIIVDGKNYTLKHGETIELDKNYNIEYLEEVKKEVKTKITESNEDNNTEEVKNIEDKISVQNENFQKRHKRNRE
jgi:hypothetical protein